ncbi:MAG TPA: ABATE domain-containing protein [Gemmatimonadales bacterium]|nr:ABATE domain-containing protein [Gemmatimonadales bacterium]
MADPEFILLGDALWLDFVNTARGRGPVVDRIPDAAAYHRWAKATRIGSDADETPFQTVRRFRARLIELATALHGGTAAPSAVVSALNQLLERAHGREQLTREGGAWRLRFGATAVPEGLVAIAHSVATTLSDAAVEVHECAADECTLFFAVPKGALERRWCSLEPCGRETRVERRRGAFR